MFYPEMAAFAAEMLSGELGGSLTIRGAPVAGDPITGAGGSVGADRVVSGVVTGVDLKLFDASTVQTGDRMLVVAGVVSIAERWVDGLVARPIVAVRVVKPDNATLIITKAHVR
jgi:hypothetical protein